MGFLIIIPFAALAGWSVFAIVRWLRRGGYGRDWWRAFMILGCVGVALGIWFAFFTKYTMANIHLEGFPIPVSIEDREKPNAPPMKSSMPVPILVGGRVTDVMAGIALSLAPIAVAMFYKENKGKLGNENPPPARSP